MYYFLKILLFIPLRLLCFTKIINKKNLPKKGEKLIVCCNHQSGWDVAILVLCLPYKMHFIAKKELYKNKFLAWILKNVHAICIDRENMSIDSMKQMLRLLKDNKVICIFPEGTRNKTDNDLLPFKEGIEVIAQKTNTPILITAISKKPKPFKINKLYIGETYYCEKGIDNKKILEEKTLALLNKGEEK